MFQEVRSLGFFFLVLCCGFRGVDLGFDSPSSLFLLFPPLLALTCKMWGQDLIGVIVIRVESIVNLDFLSRTKHFLHLHRSGNGPNAT